ncbi:MAG: cyclic lactone autoinducer peptide [Clostridium sp.]|jgi:cyclic lactone autoinducer peptide|nr:cyclic lactone autoinducer peptide [Clostridium sp.]MCH3963937.1 cyclic lactone autoinducer peptide [Clostridium sp.]MCI1716138.1 cyclic lactone autoinducer peptide [Clostridium sp.]MCI1800622.1 cyclic lactone autoinducer peptide [Clostridium sp.]MCI1814315.1 cyclic lactone autoinducer peptide [Clostridium sp.]MCI1871214.1 cyclic lactone autoinducer peptide [Clostridium sp.]
MKNVKGFITKNLMKGIGSLALVLGALVIFPNSLASGYQPKCPDELLK